MSSFTGGKLQVYKYHDTKVFVCPQRDSYQKSTDILQTRSKLLTACFVQNDKINGHRHTDLQRRTGQKIHHFPQRGIIPDETKQHDIFGSQGPARSCGVGRPEAGRRRTSTAKPPSVPPPVCHPYTLRLKRLPKAPDIVNPCRPIT